MTTAHRVTYHPAIGSAHAGGFRYYVPRVQVSAKDQVAHTKIKCRQAGQNQTDELQQRDLKTELGIQERIHQLDQLNQQRQRQNLPLLTELPSDNIEQLLLPDDNTVDAVEINADELNQYNDADDDTIQVHDSSDESDSDAETAQLQAELERIKAERAAAKIKAEQTAELEKNDISAIELQLLQSNPLLAATHGINTNSQRITRSWTDDAVFSNNAKDHDVINKVQKRFINDSVRSDFHRNFLRKYVKS